MVSTLRRGTGTSARLAAVTLAELPNLRDATRGWTSFQCQAFERNVRAEGIRDGLADGVVLEMQATAYGPEARVGRIAPAAMMAADPVIVGGDPTTTLRLRPTSTPRRTRSMGCPPLTRPPSRSGTFWC